MKIRNGFVSNSSSSSFILIVPKGKELKLSEIEDYVGGFTDELTPAQQGAMTYLLFMSQYVKQENGDVDRRYKPEEGEAEIHKSCSATWKQMQEIMDCPHWIQDENEYPYSSCQTCKYLKKEFRPVRCDDYYHVIEWCSDSSLLEKMTPDKNVYEIEVDTNGENKFLDWEDAYAIKNAADNIFKKHDVIWEFRD